MFKAVSTGNVEVVKELLDNGFNPNEDIGGFNTPLYLAVESRNTEMVALLLSYGANPNTFVAESMTPLHSIACILSVDELCSLMKVYGDTITLNNYIKTFFVYNETRNLKITELLISYGANVNVYNCKNLTPLHIAASSGSRKMVAMLLEHGANVTAQTSYHETALHFAVSINSYEISELLIENGVDINAKNMDSVTALHLAMEVESQPVVALLLHYGANVDDVSFSRYDLCILETVDSFNFLDTIQLLDFMTLENHKLLQTYLSSALFDWKRYSATSKIMLKENYEPCLIPITFAVKRI